MPALRRRPCRRAGRCGGRLLRRHRLHAGADRARLRKARELGLPVKLHAEQLSNLGGAQLAARYGALSADHVEYLRLKRMPRRWRRRARSRCCCPAPSTPCARHKLPPVDCVPRARRADGGRDRLQSRLLAADLAPAGDEHGLHAVSPDAGGSAGRRHAQRGAARSGSTDSGVIAPGMRADLAVWDVGQPGRTGLSHRLQPAARTHLRRRA